MELVCVIRLEEDLTSVKFQKTAIFMKSAVRTLNLEKIRLLPPNANEFTTLAATATVYYACATVTAAQQEQTLSQSALR